MADQVGNSETRSVFDLGEGLELWWVEAKDLKEQDENARVQDRHTFDRLTETIKRDKRLESLPFCAATDRGVEVVSGHHRTRAMMAAGLPGTWALVDITGLSRDRISAKQLAHNSIQGTDDPQVLSRIFESIQDAEARLEAFVAEELRKDVPTIKVDDVTVDVPIHQVGLMFMAAEKDLFERAVQMIKSSSQETWLAEQERFEPFRQLCSRMAKEYDIRAMGTILAKLAEIALYHLGDEEEPTSEIVALRDIFGRQYVSSEHVDAISTLAKELSYVRK